MAARKISSKPASHWTTERHLKKTRSTELIIQKQQEIKKRIPLKEIPKNRNIQEDPINSSLKEKYTITDSINHEIEETNPTPPINLLINTPIKTLHPISPESKLEIECSPRIKNYRSIRKLSFAKN